MARTPGAKNKTAREHKKDAEIATLKARLADERAKRIEAEQKAKKK